MKIGDRISITRDYYGQRDGGSLIGRTGTIRQHELTPSQPRRSLIWDIEFDCPLPDGRRFLWFSTNELATDVVAATSRQAQG